MSSINSEARLLYPVAPVHSSIEDPQKPDFVKPVVKQLSRGDSAKARARAVASAAGRGSLWLQMLFFAFADPVLTSAGAFVVWWAMFLSVLLLPLCCLGLIAFHIPLTMSRGLSNAYAWCFRTLGLPCPSVPKPSIVGGGPRCISDLVAAPSWRALAYVAVIRPVVHYLVWCGMKLLVSVAFAGILMPVATAILRGVAGHASAGVAIGGLVIGLAVLSLALCATAAVARITSAIASAVLSSPSRPVLGYSEIGAEEEVQQGRAGCSAGSCIGKTVACTGLGVCTILAVAACLTMSFAVYGGIACHSAVPVGNSTYTLDASAINSTLTVDALNAGGPIARWLGVRVEVITGAVAAVRMVQTAAPGTAAMFAGRTNGAAFVVGPSNLRASGGCLRALLQDIATCPRANVRLTVPVAPAPMTSVAVHTHGKINAKECCGNILLSSITLNSTRGCVRLGETYNAASVELRTHSGKVKTASLTGNRLTNVLIASGHGRVKAACGEGERIEADNITILSHGWRRTHVGALLPRVAANVTTRGCVEVSVVRLGYPGVTASVHSKMGEATVESVIFGAAGAQMSLTTGWWGDAEISQVTGFAGTFNVSSHRGEATFGADAASPAYTVTYDQLDDSDVRGVVSRSAGALKGMGLIVRARGGDASVDALA